MAEVASQIVSTQGGLTVSGTINGDGTIGGPISGNGVLYAEHGTLDLTGTVAGGYSQLAHSGSLWAIRTRRLRSALQAA